MPAAVILAATLVAGCTAEPVPTVQPAASDSPIAGEGTASAEAPPGAATGGTGNTGDGGAGGVGETAPPGPPPQPSAPQPTAPQTPKPGPSTPPPSNGPKVAVTSMACNGTGSFQKLRVQLTASYNNKYRKGITAVWLTRLDNLGTGWIAPVAATWAGEYAGRGDMWSGELLSRKPTADGYDANPDYGKVLKVRVQVEGGQIWEFEYPIERPC
ncbi:MAG: hypothetical protein EAS51_01565 [Microbacteriaceae bacterium]|nr:MAG: hypothetical protein EAS51_01565 [Microbacteriaceae bacterium]